MQLRLRTLPIVQAILAAITIGLVLLGLFMAGGYVTPLRLPAITISPLSRLPISFAALPGGGRTLFPRDRLVAVYGSPGEPALGVLGQQANPEQAMALAKAFAAKYRPLSKEQVVPACEIIVTIASAYPTSNNDYSREVDPAVLQQWVIAARLSGVYVILDLQPGRSDFLSQAQAYESLLIQPNVGLALDPEWRLGAGQVPLAQIGSVSADEVNGVAAWLAGLTSAHNLPQKLLLLHEFRADMLESRNLLDTSYPQLAYVVQMDGQGTPAQKANTWAAVTATPPANVRFGWKNFTVEDTPMLTPEQTMAITPQPWYVSYQ